MSLRVGYGKVDITPPLGLDLCGFGYYLDRKATAVRDPLWCRAMAVASRGETCVLISCDLIGLSVAFTDVLRVRIADAHGLGREHVLIACTHTHYGPATIPLEGLGQVDADYLADLERGIRAAADQAMGDLADAVAACGERPVDGVCLNRRGDSEAPVDSTVRVLTFYRDKDTVCLAFYACHPVTLGAGVTAVSADWPGALAEKLESGGLKPLVFQGCCGDLDPVVRGPDAGAGEDGASRAGGLLARAVVEACRSAKALDRVDLQAMETRLSLPLQVPDPGDIDRLRDDWIRYYQTKPAGFDSIPNAERFERAWADRARRALPQFQEYPWVGDVPVQALRIGDVLLLGLPGEVFSEIGQSLRHAYEKLLVITCSGGSVGYIPTADAYQDPRDYACYVAPRFYQVFPFKPSVSAVVSDASRAVLAALRPERDPEGTAQ